MAKKPDALRLLQQAEAYVEADDWEKARDYATRAIEANPDIADAYETRAVSHRNLRNLEAAIADYGRAIELDPHNAAAWMLRGACRTELAALQKDHADTLKLMIEAHPDYRRSAELRPESEQTGLALLELEICIGKYTEAIGTTGEWWERIQRPGHKLVCAWLGAIAMILAGRPERRWKHFWDFLKQKQKPLNPHIWCVVEIDQHIRRLEQQGHKDARTLREIHALFLGHFEDIEALRRGMV